MDRVLLFFLVTAAIVIIIVIVVVVVAPRDRLTSTLKGRLAAARVCNYMSPPRKQEWH
jgi:hypothetical protein